MWLKHDRLHMLITVVAAVMALMMLLILQPSVSYADEESSILEPQHGIPLVIVNIDESEEAIAAAKDKDPDHEYGTIKDMNSSEKHTVRCTGSVKIKVPDGYPLPEGDNAWIEADLPMDYIRGRGNSTWDNDKRPYKIQLSANADLFGMGESQDWALMANFYDHSIMHNRITFWLGTQLGMLYTPDCIPVDVVMAGADGPVYLGVYDLSETVKIEESRVAIDKLKKKIEDTEIYGDADHQKTGGYLFSIFASVQKEDPESNTFTTKNGIEMHFDKPEFMVEEELNDWQKEQRAYLREYVQNVEDLIFDCDEIDAERHEQIAGLLDLESVADYWLVQEFTENGDAYGTGSTYFFKPRGGKMYFGPLWDFDLAWGRIYDDEADVDACYGFNHTKMQWVDELRAKDPEFVNIVKQEWAEMDPALTQLTKNGEIIDQYYNEIRSAYDADPVLAAMEDENLEGNVEGLRKWIDERHRWFSNNQDKIGDVYAKVTYIAEGKTVFVQDKARIDEVAADDPAVPKKEGYYFVGWFTEDGRERTDVHIKEDTVLYAKYVDEEHAILPEALFLKEYETWEEVGSWVEATYDYTVFPSEVVSDKIVWTSSDESIATIDSIGEVQTLKAGDVILTASTINGVKAELVLHVVEEGALDRKDLEGVEFNEQEIRIKTGEFTQAKWHLLPEGVPVKKDYSTFRSSDDEVAFVDSRGVITGISPGTAEITVIVSYGEDIEVTDSVKVIVTDNKDPSDRSGTAAGTTHKAGGNTYKIIKDTKGNKTGTAAFIKAANKKSVSVPATVTIKGKKFNVTRIDAGAFKGKKIRKVTIGKNVKTIRKNAFRGSKATGLVVKSKLLKKNSVKGSLKGSGIKKVQVKVGKKSLNKKYIKKYKKIFTKKNAGKKVRIS